MARRILEDERVILSRGDVKDRVPKHETCSVGTEFFALCGAQNDT
jgi:hypothetical protein